MAKYPPPKLIFMDSETTGLDDALTGRPEPWSRILELSVCQVDANPATWPKDPIIQTFRWHATPELLASIPEGSKALQINGYTPDHPDWAGAPLMDSPESKAQWEKVLPLFKFRKHVNQNVPFDRGFLVKEMELHGLCKFRENRETKRPELMTPWDRRFVELYGISHMIAEMYGLESMSLPIVYTAIGGPDLPPHRSESDVKRAMAVYRWGYERMIPTGEGLKV